FGYQLTARVGKARRRLQTTACDISWPSLLKVENEGESAVTAQFVIEVQSFFIRHGFQQFSCVPSYRPNEDIARWVLKSGSIARRPQQPDHRYAFRNFLAH